jgi:hypothetical protein
MKETLLLIIISLISSPSYSISNIDKMCLESQATYFKKASEVSDMVYHNKVNDITYFNGIVAEKDLATTNYYNLDCDMKYGILNDSIRKYYNLSPRKNPWIN